MLLRDEPLEGLAREMGVEIGDLSPPASRRLAGPDGVLHLLDWGGDGPPALLLHGGALTARTWDYVALGLRADFRLLALDLRGHGDSHWAETYPLEAFVADVLAVVDQLGAAPCHLAGMSLGGVVAGLSAQAAPDHFASLALVDVAPGVNFASTARMRDFIGAIDAAASVEAVVARALAVSPRSHPGKVAYRMSTLLTQTDGGDWRWKQDRRRPTDFPAILAMVGVLDQIAASSGLPTLLVRGGRSRVLTAAAAEAFAQAVRGARISVAPDAGHNVQEDNPAHLVQTLRTFWTAADAG
ncbi:alpha/beta hydrolase [Phenylobacterium sp. 20VBR1]|uniref:Alpha/beta hydrolase n=1 Tax=Phenylobacterium glaciei TaxID=2803784 RepID=A0A941HUC1_9CAUL|nr:alpha/beta hydrolase [Phenylobacterium glaciei]MBR7618499.1 alpha/beta hydrolase [Phenylobacterium glaciei]